MFSDEKSNEKVDGINCSVSNCEYHGGGNTCHAGSIKVGTEYAGSKDETICATFNKKSK